MLSCTNHYYLPPVFPYRMWTVSMLPKISSFVLVYSNYLDIVINNYDSCFLIQTLKYIFLSCVVHRCFSYLELHNLVWLVQSVSQGQREDKCFPSLCGNKKQDFIFSENKSGTLTFIRLCLSVLNKQPFIKCSNFLHSVIKDIFCLIYLCENLLKWDQNFYNAYFTKRNEGSGESPKYYNILIYCLKYYTGFIYKGKISKFPLHMKGGDELLLPLLMRG